ncbi:MAG TPA: glycosyltransferase family 4 protein [Verrucomicrobiae bacterium]|nr:glycosyltransferase family 4 protein [Verrucomicrobiae bacterium]
MKILLCSYLYAPSIGGTETVGVILAKEFSRLGHQVKVVTRTSGPSTPDCPITRKPALRDLIQLTRWADVVFHNNISLGFAWPLCVIRKPWVITHHTWIQKPGGQKGVAEKLKLRCSRFANNISISSAIALQLPAQSRVIPDPYDSEIFHVKRSARRTKDLIFVGRLVSDKGADLLLDALVAVRRSGLKPNLTVVGDGPERIALQNKARALGLAAQITFLGTKTGEELAGVLNEHALLVVPSRWPEPFGVVALEGIACGCAVLGTSGGGLPEAIGPCGKTVLNGDSEALAEGIIDILRNQNSRQSYLRKAESHLKSHHPATIAEKYIHVFTAAISARS